MADLKLENYFIAFIVFTLIIFAGVGLITDVNTSYNVSIGQENAFNTTYARASTIYNDTYDCNKIFNEYPTEGLTTSFNLVDDGISDYELLINTPDDGVNYTIFPYIDNNTIAYTNNLTFTTDGSNSYSFNVTGLVNDMDALYNLSSVVFRFVPDSLGEIGDLSISRTVIDFGTLSTCQENYCELQYDFLFPIGFEDEFLQDRRIFLRANSTKEVNVTYHNYSSGNDTFITTLGAGLTTVQLVYTGDAVANNTLEFHFATQNFLEDDYLFIERLEAVNTYNGSYVYSLRGNDELVVSQGLQNMSEIISGLDDAQISVLPDVQLGQIIIIIIFFVLLFAGYYIPASILGMAYSFIYLDGILTLVGAGIYAIILYGGWKNRDSK